MSELLSVRFTQMTAPYSAGETAGFERAYAFKLATSGAAVLVDPPAGYDEHGQELVELIEGYHPDDFDLSASRKPKHKGGGVYEVAGVRVKGKAKAEAIASAVADLPTPEPEGGGD